MNNNNTQLTQKDINFIKTYTPSYRESRKIFLEEKNQLTKKEEMELNILRAPNKKS